MPPFRELAGQTFNRLTAISKVGSDGSSRTMWECLCLCGNKTTIRQDQLTSKTRPTKSCGCLNKEILRKPKKKTEGQSVYKFYFGCYKTSARKRGLEFSLSFENFKYLTGLSCNYCNEEPQEKIKNYRSVKGQIKFNGIDRVNNDLGYSLENCVPCCKDCNRAKQCMSEEDFINLIQKIYFHTQSKNNLKLVVNN